MKKVSIYRKGAVLFSLLALIFVGNRWQMERSVWGAEIELDDSDIIFEKLEDSEDFPPAGEETEDIFTDGSGQEEENPSDREGANSDVQVSEGGGYYASGGGYSSGGGGTQGENVIRKPQLFLTTTNFDYSGIEAGKEAPFTAGFVNKSKKYGIYNLKLTLSTDNGNLNFSPNSFYFSKVSPGQEISINTIVKAAADMAETSVPVVFTFEYEDKKGTPASGTESRSFSIKQLVKVELSAGEIPSYLFASDTEELTLGALNLSRTKVYNVRISLTGTGVFPKEEIFIGNMEPGTKSEGVMNIYVGTRTMKDIGEDTDGTDKEKYGPVKGEIVLTYEDYEGNPGSIRQEFHTEIKKPQILSLNVEEEKEANSWWISVFTVGILGLFGVVLLLLWKLRRKNVLLEEARKEGFYEKA